MAGPGEIRVQVVWANKSRSCSYDAVRIMCTNRCTFTSITYLNEKNLFYAILCK